MTTLYNRTFLKFLISYFIFFTSQIAQSQSSNAIHTFPKELELIVLFFIIISVIIITKVIHKLFVNKKYHLNKENFEASLNFSTKVLDEKEKFPQYNHLFVNNQQIDELTGKIINTSLELVNYKNIDIKDKYTAENSVSRYVPKVIDTYKYITPSLRDIKADNQSSAHDMTLEQLEIILKGLEEIKSDLVTN